MRKVIASPFVTLDGFMAGPQGEIGMPLKLIESKTFHSGVVILHYQRA